MRWSRVLWNLTPGEFVWIACGLLLLGYELFAAAKPSDGVDVLTRAWRAHSLRWIVLPFGSGVLFGHLCGPAITYWSRWSPAVFAALLAGALAFGLLHYEAPSWARLPLFLFGVLVGVLCWPGRP